MLYKVLLILKYFLHTDEGVFRKSYLFQVISIYLGSFIIFSTLSIMDGMEYEIFNKVTGIIHTRNHYYQRPRLTYTNYGES